MSPRGCREDDDDYSEITQYNLLVPNVELSTGCAPQHIPGSPPSVEAQSISQRLLSLLHTSKLVPPDDLRIFYYLPPTGPRSNVDITAGTPIDQTVAGDRGPEEGAGDVNGKQQKELKAFWTLYIDVLCISHGGSGSVFDASWFSILAALRDTVLPRAWWDADTEQVLCSPLRSEAKRLGFGVTRRRKGSGDNCHRHICCPVPLNWGVFVPERRFVLAQRHAQNQNHTDLMSDVEEQQTEENEDENPKEGQNHVDEQRGTRRGQTDAKSMSKKTKNLASTQTASPNATPQPKQKSKTSQQQVTGLSQQHWILCDLDSFEEECCVERGTVVVDLRPPASQFQSGSRPRSGAEGTGREFEPELLKLEKSGGMGLVGSEEMSRTDRGGLIQRAVERWWEWWRVWSEQGEAQWEDQGVRMDIS